MFGTGPMRGGRWGYIYDCCGKTRKQDGATGCVGIFTAPVGSAEVMEYRAGDTVLVRGVVGRDGVVLGPGVEVGQRCLDIVGDVPVFDQANQPVAMLLFFADENSMRQFAERISDDPDIDVRMVESVEDDYS